MFFRILYQDDFLVAIDKPAGFHVHPPEDPSHRISPNVNCLHLLRKQLGTYLYPVHRLDRATSGVLIYALSSDTARSICETFQRHEVRKVYYCVTRGWTDEGGTINRPLREESLPGEAPREPAESITTYLKVAQMELPYPVDRYPTARYSLLQVEPKTGRRHQIRRHLDRHTHPLVGDTVYGSGPHNRFFREQLKIQGLLLKAHSLEFKHPHTGQPLKIVSRWNGLWHQVFDLFGVCPIPSIPGEARNKVW